MNIEKLYSTLAKIIGERENVEIKFKIERRSEREKENNN